MKSYGSVIIVVLAFLAPLYVGAKASAALTPDAVVAQYRMVRAANKAGLTSFIPPAQVPSSLDYYAGQVVEVSGRIVGTAPMDDGRLLILDCDGVSVTVHAPTSAPSYWLDTGAIIRCLVKVPAQDELPESHGVLALVASAPEGAVAAADQAEAAAEAAKQEAIAEHNRLAQVAVLNRYQRRSSHLTSRAANYELVPGFVHGHPLTALSQSQLAVYDTYRAAFSKVNPRLSQTDLDKITTSILYYSGKENLDPRFIIAMIIAESGFDMQSTSRTGAMGLGQLMPETAAGLGVTNAYDPIQNIGAAVHILSGNVRKYGGATPSGLVPERTLLLCMAAYNAGGGAVKKYGGIPPYRETQVYVRRVSSIYRTLCGND